ncbi:hypothetical protein QYF36_020358 [Acer negundo]|nr:hypothetical protein QYF36_020358 [Acer negundo]
MLHQERGPLRSTLEEPPSLHYRRAILFQLYPQVFFTHIVSLGSPLLQLLSYLWELSKISGSLKNDTFPAWAKDVKECEEYHVNRETGLSDAKKRQAIHGYNELEKHEGSSILRLIGYKGIEKKFVKFQKLRDEYLEKVIGEIRLKKNTCSTDGGEKKIMSLVETVLSLQQYNIWGKQLFFFFSFFLRKPI